MEANEKKRLIKKHSPHTRVLKNAVMAFIFGSLICGSGQIIFQLLLNYMGDTRTSATLVTLIFIFIGSALTGFGVFDRIARHAGAGTLVPVTGFSNAVTSEAMDSESEGTVLGVGAKIFTVAGPVILFGVASGVVYGLIYFAVELISQMI
jgi:stage V sporulation protein AC